MYVFQRTAGSWAQQAYVKTANTGANDQLGWSVALSATDGHRAAREHDTRWPTDYSWDSD